MIRKVTAYGVNVDFIGILFSELRSPSFQNTKINGNIVIYVDKLRIVVPILQIHSNSFPFANMLLYIANAESPVILRDTARREGIIPSITGTE